MYQIVIGIDSSRKSYTDSNFAVQHNNKSSFYGLCCLDLGTGKVSKKDGTKYVCDIKIKPNDVIKMRLNTCNKTLKFWINDEEINVDINNIDFRNKIYNMAFSSYDKQNTIEIINFSYAKK